MVSAEDEPRRAGTIWVVDLDCPTPEVLPRIQAAFRRVGPESLADLAATMGPGSTAEILSRFDKGRICCTAWVEDTLAAYGWVSFNEEDIGELNLRLRLLTGEAYIWDCATLPAFRQQHLYSALLAYMVNEMRVDRLWRVWIGANLENEASQRGIDRAGFRRVADLFIARVLTTRLIWAQGYPDVPESLVAEARRAFLDNHEKIWTDGVPSSSLG